LFLIIGLIPFSGLPPIQRDHRAKIDDQFQREFSHVLPTQTRKRRTTMQTRKRGTTMFVRILSAIGKVLLAGLAVAAGGSTARAQVPKGWYAAGSHPSEYDMVVDKATKHGGVASVTIRCKEANPSDGFGTLMQTFKAEKFQGKRLRLTGFVKSSDVADWAGLWVRVDGAEKTCLAFDNMMDRKIEGTTAWTKYSVVLDVPEDAAAIAFGLLMAGKGQVWVDDLAFDVVGPEVATTGLVIEPEELPEDAEERFKASLKLLPKEPKNLGFES
jgi:hypothetical protein